MKWARCGSALVLCIAPLVADAAEPMSYLRTFGPAGDPVTRLGWGLGIVALAVCAIVGVLLLAGMLPRVRPPLGRRELAVRDDSGGTSWIYIGVGISTLVLLACAIWTMATIAAVAMPAQASETTVQISAAQWWWNVRYLNRDPSRIFTTANEIHIPVGRPVRFELESRDVIHSFWIPRLAGKIDVIPGQTNTLWLQADAPGTYRGQCGEYCGAQHAHMAMWVVADEPRDYIAWSERQLRPAAPPASEALERGQQAFVANCGACHSIRGTPAGGILGPDLTHLMSRGTIAAGLLRNTPGNLAAWIADSQALKPGSRMPSMAIAGNELSAIVSYLQTLQ